MTTTIAPRLKRSPLAAGREYRYDGFPSGFRVRAIARRGHPADIGGVEGVSIIWQGFSGRKGSVFIPCKTDEEFFGIETFHNAYDKTASGTVA